MCHHVIDVVLLSEEYCDIWYCLYHPSQTLFFLLQCRCCRWCLPEWPSRGEKTQTRFVLNKKTSKNLDLSHINEGSCWFEMFCVSDVVISFVKKTVAGVAGLLRLRSPLTTRCEKPRHYEDTQVCVPTPSIRHVHWKFNTGKLEFDPHIL